MENTRPLDVIAKEFNTTARNLIAFLERKSRDPMVVANLDRLTKRIQLVRSTVGDAALVEASAPFFVQYSDQIIERNEDFLNNMNIRQEYLKHKSKLDEQDNFVLTLAESIRASYNKATPADRDAIYGMVKTMFTAAIEYSLATSD